MYDSVEKEQQEVDDKLAELEEGVEGMHIDDLEYVVGAASKRQCHSITRREFVWNL